MTDEFIPPKTWDELVSLKQTVIDDPVDIIRTPFRRQIYLLYRKYVPASWRRLRILHQIGHKPYNLVPNNFPYDLLLKKLPRVKHYCLWSRTGSLTSPQIEKIITDTYPHHQFFWFENLDKYKSVPEIWHYHVFINDH
jgi:hypothetical protein